MRAYTLECYGKTPAGTDLPELNCRFDAPSDAMAIAYITRQIPHMFPDGTYYAYNLFTDNGSRHVAGWHTERTTAALIRAD